MWRFGVTIYWTEDNFKFMIERDDGLEPVENLKY